MSVGRLGVARYRRAMRSDPTCKTIFADRFMVEELMRWLVADLTTIREPVPAQQFPLARSVVRCGGQEPAESPRT